VNSYISKEGHFGVSVGVAVPMVKTVKPLVIVQTLVVTMNTPLKAC
jgi:hypothetical protein